MTLDVLKSHLKVGHVPILWLSGKEPKGPYWDEIQQMLQVKDADTVCNVDNFLSTGGNLRTAADLWRFNFLFKNGGLYCDCDALALKKFPDDDWIVCSENNDDMILSIGVLKAPPKQKLFSDCISNLKKEWGNIEIFTKAYLDHFGHTNSTHNSLFFYPYKWKECYKLLSNLEIPDDCYSVHFYTKALEDYLKKRPEVLIARVKQKIFPKSIDDFDEKWCKKNPETLLSRLWLWLDEK